MTQPRRIITQGEHFASAERQLVISTLLGSCVACCLWDPVAQLGGMNHMLLTSTNTRSTDAYLSGVNSMEVLINDIVKLGGDRRRLEAKVFGGAKMIEGLSNIGADNATFVLDFLNSENITCNGQSLGGNFARQILFFPHTGIARQKVQHKAILAETMTDQEENPGNGLELFGTVIV